MMLVTKLLKSATGEDNANVETFIVADRKVRTGLIASAVVSVRICINKMKPDPTNQVYRQSWLWSTMLLSTTLVAYQYGISGPFWYGAGCAPMIVCFAYLGIVCKKRVPNAHTVLEIIKYRYGTTAHVSFIFLAILNNLFNTINMILGAAATITSLFLTDYIHTLIILVLCCYLTTKALTNSEVSSIGGLYDLVQTAQPRHMVEGNLGGSLLTMSSQQGIFFGIILMVSNFGAVIVSLDREIHGPGFIWPTDSSQMDAGYFTKAFAASPEAVVPGYVIGGICYFSIPWALGTVMGMTVLGLETSRAFPTFPRQMTSGEITGGLALPYGAMAIAGKGGAVATLLMTFMSVTSTLSAQVIAVSSVVSFDVYKTYWNPKSSHADLIRWNRIGVVIFGLIAAGLTAVFNHIGLDMGWTLYMIGIIVCPGMFPLILTILWKKQSRAAAIASAYLGMATGIGIWLGTAYKLYDVIDISTTGATLPCMYGTLGSALSPLLYSFMITMVAPQKFDWESMKGSQLVTGDDIVSYTGQEERPPQKIQKRVVRTALFWAMATFFGIWVLWPLPMYAAKFVMGRKLFIAWVTVSLIWLWITLIVIGVYPLWSGRDQIALIIHKFAASKK
ncbi:unnamed protein product [Penicillium salamii]|uniref:Sodium/solute symporter n=1 Tax=Penicillium salamii TaxID=1612424 RepID=A0A9W4ITT9_9EURO|nr:unnamed protein product [Penicillium salamii]CAG8291897.1 unnamed protein product [Penicillium salamii]CAG8343831.1 unnamed protein product [Penicillium salamii]CAG8345689.1 unnamed protein product [Penicillium salamii]CAG8351558.1 unnamed protein product [Penicillium salamii]